MSSSSGESLCDFSDGSSDYYEPSDISELSEEAQSVPTKKKRRMKNENNWQRNLKKKNSAEGKKYKTVRGREVGPRVTGEDCTCKYKCFEYVDVRNRIKILKMFNKIGDKHKQDIYLAGLIKGKQVARRRPKQNVNAKRTRNFSNVYTIKCGTGDRKVCKKAFASIHGISLKRVQNIAAHLNQTDSITAPNDQRGKHANRPNRVPDAIVEQVHNHILSFPRRVSHYSRRDSKRYYLSPHLNIKLMHEFYLQRYEPEMYNKLMSQSKDDYKPLVSRDFYFRYLKANFNYTFGSPRSDTCVKCDSLENLIKSGGKTPEEIENLKVQKQLHLIKAETFYNNLREKTSVAKEDPTIDVLSFDYQQNLPLPKVPSGDAFYSRQLWLYNFCIHSAKNMEAHCFLFDETTGSKKPNETVSCLNHYINNILSQSVTELVLFSDNCSAQNKNHTVVQYLLSLVKNGRFTKIVHYLPVPGHSFLPCDRCFGVIEKKLKLVERVFVPDEYHVHIKNASKKFKTINVTQNMIYDFGTHFQEYFKKYIVNEKKEKFSISKYRVFEYRSTHPSEVWVTENMNFYEESCVKFKILKGSSLPSTLPTNKVYKEQLPVKPAKYADIIKLVNKFVPQNDIWYYDNLKCVNNEDVQEDESTDAQDED